MIDFIADALRRREYQTEETQTLSAVDQVDNQSLVSQLRPDGPQRRFIDYYGILT